MCGHREHAFSLFEIRRVADRGPPDKNSHPESLASRETQNKRCPLFRPTGPSLGREDFTDRTNSAIPDIHNHHFEIEGRWSTHGNEESSEEACKEGPGQEEEVVAP
jgi:hypothetical protein